MAYRMASGSGTVWWPPLALFAARSGAPAPRPPVATPAAASAPSEPPRLDIPAEPCAGRAGCEVRERTPAGTDSEGRRLEVVLVDLRPTEDCAGDVDGSPGSPTEHWLVVFDREGIASSQLLLVSCPQVENGVLTEDSLEVGPRARSGPRASA